MKNEDISMSIMKCFFANSFVKIGRLITICFTGSTNVFLFLFISESHAYVPSW